MSSEEKPDAKVHWDRRRFLIGGAIAGVGGMAASHAFPACECAVGLMDPDGAVRGRTGEEKAERVIHLDTYCRSQSPVGR